MHRKTSTLSLVAVLVALLAARSARAEEPEHLVVRVGKPYDAVAAVVRAVGGEVDHAFDNIDALAVRVPAEQVPTVALLAGRGAVTRDRMIPPPGATRAARVAPAGTAVLGGAAMAQAIAAGAVGESYNNLLTRAAAVHASGLTGQEVVVAVIDTGVADAPVATAIAGAVIGGESFAPEPLSATSRHNDAHGTWVATMIAAHTVFAFPATSPLAISILTHAPQSAFTGGSCAAGNICVPLVGVAPDARLYALKIFGVEPGGVPESRMAAAMDRTITLRRNFDLGMPAVPVAGSGTEDDPHVYDALPIQVANLSFGQATLFAGQDLLDGLTREMLAAGIVPVVATGNGGFAALTGLSPGTGIGSLTVGSIDDARHARVAADVALGPGAGVAFRPTSHVQTAWFSARGPTADGRLDPELLANGSGALVQAADGTIELVNGTSLAAPMVAGAAAVLRSPGAPDATAIQLRNAIVDGARWRLVGDGSDALDQGAGVLDVAAALEALPTASRRLPDAEPCGHDGPSDSVARNVERAGFDVVRFRDDRFTTHVRRLRPGQVEHLFVPVDERTEALTVRLVDVEASRPASEQNTLFGDTIFLQVVDAPTSQSRFRVRTRLAADAAFEVEHPQTGLVRVALQGDASNAGEMGATVILERRTRRLLAPSASGGIAQDDELWFAVEVPAGTGAAEVELAWHGDWGHYPTSDLDLYLIAPDGTVDVRGATFGAPERVLLPSPMAGTWSVLVQGYTVLAREHGAGERFVIRASADGVALPARPL